MSDNPERLSSGGAPTKSRIELVDALRGLSLIVMIMHHIVYDLVFVAGAPRELFQNPVVDFLHYFSAGTFVLLAGVSCRFSRNNIKRGLRVLLVAMVVTVASSFVNSLIVFGVLHLLGTLMILWGLTHKLWDRVPRLVMPFLCIALLFFTDWLVDNVSIGGAAKLLFWLGWRYPGFRSADYFPLFPWMFGFLLGTWMGSYIKERRLPDRFYTVKVPVLSTLGRHTLLIYVVHQPLLYALMYGYKFLTSR